MPPEPPTFSIMTCWPKSSERPGARMRPTVSAGPPAANGTTMVTGRVGQSCDSAGPLHLRLATSATATIRGSRPIQSSKPKWMNRITVARMLHSPRSNPVTQSKNGDVLRPRAPARPAARDRADFPVSSNVMATGARIPDWPTLDANARRNLSLTAAERARRLEPRLNAFVSIEDRLPGIDGKLGGLPYAAKDIFRTASHRPTGGLRRNQPVGAARWRRRAPRRIHHLARTCL